MHKRFHTISAVVRYFEGDLLSSTGPPIPGNPEFKSCSTDLLALADSSIEKECGVKKHVIQFYDCFLQGPLSYELPNYNTLTHLQ